MNLLGMIAALFIDRQAEKRFPRVYDRIMGALLAGAFLYVVGWVLYLAVTR
jgi:hypothetical protein